MANSRRDSLAVAVAWRQKESAQTHICPSRAPGSPATGERLFVPLRGTVVEGFYALERAKKGEM